jgi:hypothetical protein
MARCIINGNDSDDADDAPHHEVLVLIWCMTHRINALNLHACGA